MAPNITSRSLSCLEHTNITQADLENLELDEFVGEFSQFIPEDQLAQIPDEEGTVVSLHLLPVAAIGLVLTVLYIVAVCRAIISHRVSEEFYALLLNRAIGDLLYMLLYIVDHIMEILEFSADMTGALNAVIEGVFWTAMVSYVSLSLLKLYAFSKPLHYRRVVTMMRVIILIVLSWLLFIVFVTARIYLREICVSDDCLAVVHRIIGGLHVGCYFITVVCFLITVLFVIRTPRYVQQSIIMNKISLRHRYRIPLIKLSANVSTMAIFHLPLTIVGIFLAFGSNEFWHESFPCFVVTNLSLVRTIASIIQCFFMLRIIIDPLICFVMDREVRRALLSTFGVVQKADKGPKSSDQTPSLFWKKTPVTSVPLTSKPIAR
ncbi:DihydroCaffeic Acid Receptor [Ditylenchus destructor]|nr:DihydroCaffeic Acid Receptor [Ditylenchus destructor]